MLEGGARLAVECFQCARHQTDEIMANTVDHVDRIRIEGRQRAALPCRALPTASLR